MLKISKLADYAIVIMHALAAHQGGRFSASVIAERVGITMSTVSKVLKLLHDAELVTSTRGAHGGYHLSRSATQVSLADIISAIDGRLAITECSANDGGRCQYDHHCEIRGRWQYINSMIYQFLDSMTLNDMSRSLPQSDDIPLHFYPLTKRENGHVCDG